MTYVINLLSQNSVIIFPSFGLRILNKKPGIKDLFKLKEEKRKGTLVDDKLQEKILKELEEIKQSAIKYRSLRKIFTDFDTMIKNKEESEGRLKALHDKLYCLPAPKSRFSHWFIWSDEEIAEERKLVSRLHSILEPVYKKYINDSSKRTLEYQYSGINKYPEKHSVFAATTQETTAPMYLLWGKMADDEEEIKKYFKNYNGDYKSLSGSHFTREIAHQMLSGGSIEDAIIRTNKNYAGSESIPCYATYRLSKDSTKGQDLDFEVLFITGSPGYYVSDTISGTRDEKRMNRESNTFKFDRHLLAHAIKRVYGDKCQRITTVDNPNYKEIETTLKNISSNLKGKKLYIFFHGHGTIGKIEDGITLENRDKQGSLTFYFYLQRLWSDKLSENNIKELYNKYLKDIEVITIYDSCHSGAAITAIESEELGRYVDSLA